MSYKKKAHSEKGKYAKVTYRVRNWKQYNAALCQRGDVTIWLSEEAIEQWTPEQTGKRGRPRVYSDVAIEVSLLIRTVFKQPLRQTTGFLQAIKKVMGLDIPIPHYSTLSDRSEGLEIIRQTEQIEPGSHVIVDASGVKIYGAGQWQETKHGFQKRRIWRRLHIALDEKHQLIAATMTTIHEGDSSQVPDLLDQRGPGFEAFLGDGAYDGEPTYRVVLERNPAARVVIPPPKNAVISKDPDGILAQRNEHIRMRETLGKTEWRKRTGFGLRNYAETAFFRYKQTIGGKLRARKFERQRTEALLGCVVLNEMTSLGMPVSVRVSWWRALWGCRPASERFFQQSQLAVRNACGQRIGGARNVALLQK